MCCCCRQIPLPLPPRRLRAPPLRGTSFPRPVRSCRAASGAEPPRDSGQTRCWRQEKPISFSHPTSLTGTGEEGTELPRSQRRVGCGGIIPAPATGADVTANYSIPRPSPPPKLYLREGKNNSWRGRSWNEPKDSSSISKTCTNRDRTPLPATRGRGLSPVWGSGHSPLGAGGTALRAAAVPGHLHPGSGVAAGTGAGNRSRAVLVLPPRAAAGNRPWRSPRAV